MERPKPILCDKCPEPATRIYNATGRYGTDKAQLCEECAKAMVAGALRDHGVFKFSLLNIENP